MVKLAITTSSSDSVNASIHPAAIAGTISGSVTDKNARTGSQPRSIAASSRLRSSEVRRDCTTTVTIAHTTLTLCFVAVVVQSRLGALDRSLEEAAMDLGCGPARAFVAVTLPLILPAIAAGWMLAFTLSLDDVVIASFTTGPGSATLPIRIYSEVRLGVKPEINAICTLIIGLIAVIIVLASLVSKLTSARGESAAPL